MGFSLTQILGRVFNSSANSLQVISRSTGLPGVGRITKISLDNTAWLPLPSVALASRASILVQNISGNGNVVLWNYSAASPATEGAKIEDGALKTAAISPSIVIYGRMLSGSGTVIVDEVS